MERLICTAAAARASLMPRCANKSCQTANGKRAKLPKGTLPQICSDACQKAVIAEAIAKSNAMAKRAIKKAQNVKAREEKEVRRALRRRRQALNETNLKWQKARLAKAVHALVKLLDALEPCIVCGGFECGNSTEWDAGHYLTKAAHPELKFDPRNIFKQCSPTNTASSGNRNGEASIRQKFENNIIARYGMAHLLWLKGYHPPRKYTCDELAAMWKEVNNEVKRLKRGEAASKHWRALPEHISKPMESAA